MAPQVGVLAIQGSFQKHIESLIRAGHPADQIYEVRTPKDLSQVDRLIIPGGESTTVGLLMQHTGLDQTIVERAHQGMPIWGTCMGMIMLARTVENREQFSLNLLNITVRRNAFGAQVHSFETKLAVVGLVDPIEAVFIRAPIVTEHGPEVQVLSTFNDQIVAVQHNKILGTSFHPELTTDTQLHRYFLNL
ncbi:pyridoxal 5'-phosphate synthase glutaminase subunit PdxT [Armatimonadetes bacterium Uphvl-Ar1]|nr:pyridoxal 5'-phosphate synthase glutaminase subunit PdxT [Armatimonadetes bacterium Uphvl-Ar1]